MVIPALRKSLLRLFRPLLPVVERVFDIRIRTTEEYLVETRLCSLEWLVAEARRLNDELYADVKAIPPEKLSAFDRGIRAKMEAERYPQDAIEKWLYHHNRLYLTTQWLDQVLEKAGREDLILLEMGGQTIVTEIFRDRYPQLQWINTEVDLRYPWGLASESVDVILSTEVLEHLAEVETPGEINHGFFHTGILSALQESWRVLKPGGRMLVTTPNASSVIVLKAVFNGDPPWMYKHHHREYTFDELLSLFENVGYEVEAWKAMHCLFADLREDFTSLFKILVENRLPTAHRGDDLFFVVRKPLIK